MSLRVTVWGENVHERTSAQVAALYPQGMHGAIASAIREQLPEAEVRIALLDEPEHGLDAATLAQTDVLTWWGHAAHDRVADEVADRVVARVREGMGLIALHSAHFSKPFKRLLGTPCTLRFREADDHETVWCVAPEHPIARGVPNPFVIPGQEMYGEPFAAPAPDELVFLSTFSHGPEVFRSGCCFVRGGGRVFYFSPGHETFPVYHQPEVRQVIANAVRWAARG
jgi:trehalose utilization protein